MLSGLSVLIPVYRSAAILPELLARLAKVLPGLAKDYEVIMVCDGSPDDSWTVIKTLAGQYPFIRGLNLNKNYGQHNALLAAIRAARYDVILTMDDDLQHPPEEIHKLLQKLGEGPDVVYGTSAALQHSFARNISSKAIKYAMQQLMGYENAQKLSAFRAFRTALRNSFAEYRDRFVNIDILLTWATNRFSSVEVAVHPRHSGVSGYNVRKLLLHA
ncbi:MAG: glycosyltransferase family 2 protein, partial [Alphaproteobacteria bacterium]